MDGNSSPSCWGISYFMTFVCEILSEAKKSFDCVRSKVNERKLSSAISSKFLRLANCNLYRQTDSYESNLMDYSSSVDTHKSFRRTVLLNSTTRIKESALSNLQMHRNLYADLESYKFKESAEVSNSVSLISYSLSNAFWRIAHLDFWQRVLRPDVSYSVVLSIFCRNLTMAFKRDQNFGQSCACQSENPVLLGESGTTVSQRQTLVTLNTTFDCLQLRFIGLSHDLLQNVGNENISWHYRPITKMTLVELAHENCMEPTVSLASGSNYVTVITSKTSEDSVLKQNFGGTRETVPKCSSFSRNNGKTDNLCQFTIKPSVRQSSMVFDMNKIKSIRKRRRIIPMHSFRQKLGFRIHMIGRKWTCKNVKQHRKLCYSYRAVLCSSSDDSDEDCTNSDDWFKNEVDNLAMNFKLLTIYDPEQETLPEKDSCVDVLKLDEKITTDNISDSRDTDLNVTHVTVASNRVTCDNTTDEKVSFSNTNSDELTDDEVIDEEITDDEVTTDEVIDDEVTDKDTNSKSAYCALNSSSRVEGVTLSNVSPVSSFFILPSEMDSSSELSEDDSYDVEEDDWGSSDGQSLDMQDDDIVRSLNFCSMYLPSNCSLIQASISMEKLGAKTKMHPVSTCQDDDFIASASLDCDDSYDDIVFTDGFENDSDRNGDAEDLPVPNLSWLEIINARWNNFYSTSHEDKAKGQSDGDKSRKMVCFARESILVITHSESSLEAEDYAAARKGPWEEYARDRDRFTRRIRDVGDKIGWVFSARHRNEIYENMVNRDIMRPV